MRDKLKLPIIILILVLVLIGAPVFLVMKSKKTVTLTPLGAEQKQETAVEKMATYNDSSGFKFVYPQELTVKDVSGNDQNTYSSLEISSTKQAGRTTIKIVDSPYDSLESFLGSKEAGGAGVSRDITLSSMSAKQVQFANPKRLETLAISNGIMYAIESPLDDNGFWNKVHNQIVSSLSVETQSASAVSGDSGNDQSIFNEEEIIE